MLDAFIGHPFETLIYLALATGMRQGELLGLRWQDVDLDGRRIVIRFQLQRVGGKLVLAEPKSKQSRRTLALASGMVEKLQAHRVRQMEARLLGGSLWQDTGYVFTSEVGTPLDHSNVTKRFQRRLRDAGLPRMRFHDLRHGTASLMLAQGSDLVEIKEQLGHSQINLTAKTHTHVLPALKRQAAERMDAVLGRRGG
ncbi:MAG: site-specific integrase [Dehalococcoidia bacterium]